MANRFLRILLLGVFASVLAACGGEDSTPTPTTVASAPAERRQALDATAAEAAPQAPEYEISFAEFGAWVMGVFSDVFPVDRQRYNVYTNVTLGTRLYTEVWQFPQTRNWLAVTDTGILSIAGPAVNNTLVDVPFPLQAFAETVKKAGFGDKRILVIHAKYSDTGADPFPIADTLVRVEKNRAWFLENSYGKSTQTYTVLPNWFTLPNTAEWYRLANERRQSSVGNEAMGVLADRLDLKDIDIVVLHVPAYGAGNAPNCSGGRTNVRLGSHFKLISVVVLAGLCARADIMAHELFHAYGLPYGEFPVHSSFFNCLGQPRWIPKTFTDPTWSDTNCENPFLNDGSAWFGPYGNYDFMGNPVGHTSAFWKEFAGWIGPRQVVVADRGESRITLSPLETASAGFKAIKIPLGKDQAGEPAAYWLEYRTQVPTNLESGQRWSEWMANRVRVWVNLPNLPTAPVGFNREHVSGSALYSFGDFVYTDGPSSVDLGIGDTYLDPHRGVKVERGQNVGGDAAVTVTVSKLRFDSPIGTVVSAKNTQGQRIVVTNEEAYGVTFGSFTITGRSPSSFRITADTCGNRTIPAKGGCSISFIHVRQVGDTEEKHAVLHGDSNHPVHGKPTVGIVGQP